jgi:hypothetical protein
VDPIVSERPDIPLEDTDRDNGIDPPTLPDAAIIRDVARALFVIQEGKTSPDDRKMAWHDEKKAAMRKARRLIRYLESKRVSVERLEPQG